MISFAEISDSRPLGWGNIPTFLPKDGAGEMWFAARERVERLVPAATLAFQAADVTIAYKVPGSFTQIQHFDPAAGWSTVLAERPYFSLGEVLACCARADGFFAGGLHRSAMRARRAALVRTYLLTHKPVLFGGLVGTVAGGVIGGYLLFRFGWN
jgi:hypothetical protein